MISGSMNIFSNITSTAEAQSVCKTLLEKTASELSSASSIQSSIIIDNTNSQNNIICFNDKTGNKVYITTTDRLIEAGKRMPKEDDSNIFVFHYGSDFDNANSDWTYDQSVYKNYEVTDLVFEAVSINGKKTNVIKITLKMENKRSGYKYEDFRFVECYNFDGKERLADKIFYQQLL